MFSKTQKIKRTHGKELFIKHLKVSLGTCRQKNHKKKGKNKKQHLQKKKVFVLLRHLLLKLLVSSSSYSL